MCDNLLIGLAPCNEPFPVNTKVYVGFASDLKYSKDGEILGMKRKYGKKFPRNLVELKSK